MAAKLVSSQLKSSAAERDFFTPCNMHLTPCNMQKLLLQCKVNGDLFRYIITKIQLTLVISNLMGPNKKFELSVVRDNQSVTSHVLLRANGLP